VGIYNSLMVKNGHLWCKMASVLLMLAEPTDLDTQSIKIKKKEIKGVTRGEGDIIYIFGYCNLRL